MKNYKNLKQLSTIYYFLPFTTEQYDEKAETIKIDEGFVFKRVHNNYRNLVRTDVVMCLEKIECFKLDNEYGKNLAINSYCVLRDDNGYKTDEYAKTNLSTAITLLDVWIYSFDKDNQFLVLQCCFDKRNIEDGEKPLEMNQLLSAHAHLVNNYFKVLPDSFNIKNSGDLLDILDETSFFDSFITISIKGVEYTLLNGEKSLTRLADFKFNFNDYPIQFLSQLYMLEDNLENRMNHGECLSYGVRNTFLDEPNHNVFKTKKFLSFSSGFGSTIIYYKDNKLDVEKDAELIKKHNNMNMNLLNNEIFYDFIIAINYRNRIKRQINTTGEINYDTNDNRQFEKIREEINVHYRETSLYYFESVSQSDVVNGWYKKLFERLEIAELAKELENRLNAANTYISYKIDEVRENKRNFSNKTAYILSTIVGTILAIFEMIQAIFAFTEDRTRIAIVALFAAVMTICATIGCIVILRLQNKIDK